MVLRLYHPSRDTYIKDFLGSLIQRQEIGPGGHSPPILGSQKGRREIPFKGFRSFMTEGLVAESGAIRSPKAGGGDYSTH